MNLRFKLVLTAMAAFGASSAIANGAPGNTVSIHLHPDALLNHQHVVLADVARIDSANAALRKALEEVPLGKAPRVTYVSRLSRSELSSIIARRFSAPAAHITWSGADGVALRSASHVIPIQQVADIARAALRKQFGHRYPALAMTAVSLPPDVEVPLGAVTMQARPLDGARLQARTPVWVDVMVDGALYRSAVIALQVSAMEQVYVAREAMPRGSVATPRAFEVRLEDVARLRETPVVVGAQAPLGRLKRPLAQGQVVSEPWLTNKDMVLNGDRVHLLVGSTNVQVDVMAVAQGDAALGQTVRVKIESNGEVVAGRLISQAVVQMDGR